MLHTHKRFDRNKKERWRDGETKIVGNHSA